MSYRWIAQGIVFDGFVLEPDRGGPKAYPQLFLIWVEFAKYPLDPRQKEALEQTRLIKDRHLRSIIKRNLNQINGSQKADVWDKFEDEFEFDIQQDAPEDIVGAKSLIYLGTVDEYPCVFGLSRDRRYRLKYADQEDVPDLVKHPPQLNRPCKRFLSLAKESFNGLEETINQHGESRWQIIEQLRKGWAMLRRLRQAGGGQDRISKRDWDESDTRLRRWYTYRDDSAVIDFLKRITEDFLEDAAGYIRRCSRPGCFNLYQVHRQVRPTDPDRRRFVRQVLNKRFCSYRCRRSFENKTHYERQKRSR